MISALPEEGIPFQFIKKFRKRPSENDIKLIEKCTKKPCNISVFFFFILNISTIFEEKKQARKIPDFHANQNFAFNIASSIEGLSMANQIVLSY